jgi:hypothetical protein
MSFLNSSNSDYISARITQKGRNSISKGDFKIDFFQIGDSEFDYNRLFSGFTGSTNHQMVMSPFDRNSTVKYPYTYDETLSLSYGDPILNSTIEPIRNVMGPAGFITEYLNFNSSAFTGTTIFCKTQLFPIASLTGSNQITFTGETFYDCEFITIIFNELAGTLPTVSGRTNSLTYRVVNFQRSGNNNTITLDRNTPNLTSLSGNGTIICSGCEIEYPIQSEIAEVCLPNPLHPSDQQNPWTLNVVWGQKPIGDGSFSGSSDENISGYTSNTFVSTKEFFGYTSTGQTFENLTGTILSQPTTFKNSFNDIIEVKPEEQRCIAIVHFSELGDIKNDPERFFKYDDYISHLTGITDNEISIVDDRDGNPISDTEYFEVYIPFIYYHRSTSNTNGAIFKMDTNDYFMRSTKNEKHELKFRYLLDESNNKVGKVFVNNKVIIFDDQELVAILDYRSNRKFTLGAPKVSVIPSDDTLDNSLIVGTTSQTFWVTYMFLNSTTNSSLNYLPSNYYQKVEVNVNEDICSIPYPSNISVKFSGDTFQHMNTSLLGIKDGFIAREFYVLIQETDDLPETDRWKMIRYTTEAGGNGTTYLNPSNLIGTTFIIRRDDYENAGFFDLESYMSPSNYLGTQTSNDYDVLTPQFGDEQPFPGSIRLVRSSDVEQMNFLINLPSGTYETTQNPTYVSGDKYLTEIALLNSNKEPLVVAKMPTPVKREGTQVFSVRLDF